MNDFDAVNMTNDHISTELASPLGNVILYLHWLQVLSMILCYLITRMRQLINWITTYAYKFLLKSTLETPGGKILMPKLVADAMWYNYNPVTFKMCLLSKNCYNFAYHSKNWKNRQNMFKLNLFCKIKWKGYQHILVWGTCLCQFISSCLNTCDVPKNKIKIKKKTLSPSLKMN